MITPERVLISVVNLQWLSQRYVDPHQKFKKAEEAAAAKAGRHTRLATASA